MFTNVINAVGTWSWSPASAIYYYVSAWTTHAPQTGRGGPESRTDTPQLTQRFAILHGHKIKICYHWCNLAAVRERQLMREVPLSETSPENIKKRTQDFFREHAVCWQCNGGMMWLCSKMQHFDAENKNYVQIIVMTIIKLKYTEAKCKYFNFHYFFVFVLFFFINNF